MIRRFRPPPRVMDLRTALTAPRTRMWVFVLATGEALQYQALVHSFLPRGATSFDDLRLLRSEIRLH